MGKDQTSKLCCGLLGWPVSHSASPVMMSKAFDVLAMEAVYVPFAVAPNRLSDAVRGLSALGVVGVNVTIPHKEAVFALVDRRTEVAELARAVNTVLFHPDGAIGHNTDVVGWWDSVRTLLDKRPHPRMLVLGAGGAAAAVVAALCTYHPEATVVLTSRSTERCQQLMKRFEDRIRVTDVPWTERTSAAAHADMVVNTTPLGMWPETDASPLPETFVWSDEQIVQDIVYRPMQTRLLQQAAASRATVLDGVGMLAGQGAASLKFWFDVDAPVKEMEVAVRDFIMRADLRAESGARGGVPADETPPV